MVDIDIHTIFALPACYTKGARRKRRGKRKLCHNNSHASLSLFLFAFPSSLSLSPFSTKYARRKKKSTTNSEKRIHTHTHTYIYIYTDRRFLFHFLSLFPPLPACLSRPHLPGAEHPNDSFCGWKWHEIRRKKALRMWEVSHVRTHTQSFNRRLPTHYRPMPRHFGTHTHTYTLLPPSLSFLHTRRERLIVQLLRTLSVRLP